MGILVTTAYSSSSVKNNRLLMYENATSNDLARGTCSLAMIGGGSYFEVDGNVSLHYYSDDIAAGAGTEQAFHIYIEDTDYAWSLSENVIYNDGFYQGDNGPPYTVSKSHGIYITHPGGGPTATWFRGVIEGNKIFGSNQDPVLSNPSLGHTHYEMYVTYAAVAQAEVTMMNNYLGIHIDGAPTTVLINFTLPGTYHSNGANLAENVAASVWTSTAF